MLEDMRIFLISGLCTMTEKSMADIANFVIEQGVELTGSGMGFLGLMNEEATACNMRFYSNGVSVSCAAASELLHATIENAGLWAEAVRTQKSIVINDYAAYCSNSRRIPFGHVPLSRVMSIPVISQSRVVAVVVVANKEDDYGQSDVHRLTLFMDSIWKSIEGMRRVEALRQSEEFSRALVDNLVDIVFSKDIEGRYAVMNKAGSDFLGIPPGSAIGKTDRELSDGKTAVAFAASDNIVLSSGKPLHLEETLKTRDGREVVLHITKAPLRNSAGDIMGVVGIGRDVTHQKLIERALKESEERFRFIVEKTGDVIYRLKYVDMRYDYLNPAIKNLTGYSAEEINAVGFSSLVRRIEIPGKGIVSRDSIADRRLKGETAEYLADYLIQTRSGSLQWVRDHSFPWLSEASNIIGSIGILSDITEQKQAENALRESEERYRTIFNHSPLGIMQFDSSGVIIDCNDMFLRILGSSREAIVGLDMLSSLQNGKVKKALTNALSGGLGRYEGDYTSVTGNRLASLRAIFSPITNESGKMQGGVCIAEDYTDRKLARNALQESERQLKHLSSQLLLAQETERKRVANEIHDSIGQTLHTMKAALKNLIDQVEEAQSTPDTSSLWELSSMLEFALEEVRNIYMDLRPSLLDDLGILATIKWYLRKFQLTHAGLTIKETIYVEEDEIPEHLKIIIFRVVQSAMENIAQHSAATRAQVSLGVMDGRIDLSIEDNGLGFEPGNVLLGEAGYKGLGLACMQERVESSGGLFTVKSERNMGTTIRSWWPMNTS